MSSSSKHKKQQPRMHHTGANAPKPEGRPIGTTFVLAGIAFAVIIVGAFIATTLLSGDSEESGPTNAYAIKIADAATRLPAQQDGLTLGNANAPLTIEVFEDFQCPFCVLFTATVEPAIVEEYVVTGKAKLVFRTYPILGAESELAARAAVCAAEQGKGWPYILALFQTQAQANQVGAEQLNVGRFKKDALLTIATDTGLNRDTLSTCMDGSAAGTAVQQAFTAGKALGVKGTPSFAVNGTLVTQTPQDIAGWRTLLDARLNSK